MTPFRDSPRTAYKPFIHNGFLCSCKTCAYLSRKITDCPCDECFERQLQSRFPERTASSYEPAKGKEHENYKLVEIAMKTPDFSSNGDIMHCIGDWRDVYSVGSVIYLREYDAEHGEYTGRFRVERVIEISNNGPGFCAVKCASLRVY